MIQLKLLTSPIRSGSGKLRHTVAEYEQGTAICDMLPDSFEGRLILDGCCLLPEYEDDPRWEQRLYGEHEIWAIPAVGIPAAAVPFLIIAAAALVVGAGIALASLYLFKPQLPELDTEEGSPTTAWRGITTTQGPGAVVPVIYGRHRVGGQLLAADVGFNDVNQHEGATPDSPLDLLIAIGEGYIQEIETATIELNDQPVANFTNIQTATRNGTSGQDVLPHHENIQQTFARSPADDLTAGIVIYTTTQDINGFVIEVKYPNGLYEGRATGDLSENRTTWRFRYRVSPAGGWSGYTTITNGGDQRKPYVATKKIENLALDTYDIEVEYVTSDHADTLDAWQPFLTNVTEIIDQTAPYPDTALLGLRTVSQAGLQGNLPNVTVIVKGRRVRINKISNATVTDATNATPIVVTTSAAHGFSNGSIVRIKDVEGNTAANGTWAVSNVTSNTFDLDGSTGNGAYTQNGIAFTEAWSDNPAWCLMDLMTHERYGMAIPDSEINLTAFNAYATYCDALVDDGDSGTEKRNLLDMVLDEDMSAQDAVQRILGTTRAIMVKSQGQWKPLVSQDDNPVQLISWANVIRDSVKIEYRRDVDRVNVLEARFANRDIDFEQDVLTWPQASDWPNQVRKASVELIGITRPSQIMRELLFELSRRQLSKLYLSFEAGIDQIVLEMHDIFRFSHPQPAWGQSGRVSAAGTNTLTHIVLDEDVTIEAATQYHVYVRHADDTVDEREIDTTGAPFTTRELDLAGGELNFSSVPSPRTALWAFGELSPDAAVKEFRVIDLKLTNEWTVAITAVEHNPTLFGDETPVPLATITRLFNPLGPPPPLLTLSAASDVRIGHDGIPRYVVTLEWEVQSQEAAGPDYGKYGGALIFRRFVRANAQAGQAILGEATLGEQLGVNNDPSPFSLVGQVKGGHLTSYADVVPIAGATYQYKVVPISNNEIPNDAGALTVEVTISSTLQATAPQPPLNLRIWNGEGVPGEEFFIVAAGILAAGILATVVTEEDTQFQTQDAFFAWDAPAENLTYVVEIWDTNRDARLRGPVNVSDQKYTYTRDQNESDSAQLLGLPPGSVYATRFITITVRSKNRVNILSDPATLDVSNPPPDMSSFLPSVTSLFDGLEIGWKQFVEPNDLTHYEIYLDMVNPPQTIAKNLTRFDQLVWALNLTINQPYYVQILPYDLYGPGIPTPVVEGTPRGLNAFDIDNTPPPVPTGLTLTTGTAIGDDGTIIPFVEADWDDSPADDIAHYQVAYRIGTVPFATTVPANQSEIRFDGLPGNTTVYIRVNAVDGFGNASDFTAEQSITTARDTVAPGLVTNVTAGGYFKTVQLLWTPPSDADLDVVEIWARQGTNDYGTIMSGDPTLAALVGTGTSGFSHGNLDNGETWYYWLRGVDTSGNKGAFHAAQTSGTGATTVQVDSPDLVDESVIASKLAQVGFSAALNRNPSVNDLAAWYVDQNQATTLSTSEWSVVTLSNGLVGNTALQVVDNDNNFEWLISERIPIDSSKTYRVSVVARQTAGDRNNYLMVVFYDSSGNFIAGTGSGATGWLSLGTFHYWGVANQDFTATFTRYTFTFGPSGTGSYPASATPVAIAIGGLFTATGTTQTTVQLQDLRVEEVIPGELIVNGAITAEKIAALAVTAGKIAANQINSGHLVTSTAVITTAAQIANALINDAHINNLSASKITAGTIQALANIGIGSSLYIDGINQRIYAYDQQPTPRVRVLMGRLGAGTEDWGIQFFNGDGTLIGQVGGTIDTNIVMAGNPITAANVGTYIASAAIGTAYIANAAINNALIADGAISTAKIQTAAIKTAQIDDLNVTTLKISNHAVTDQVEDYTDIDVFVTTEQVIATITFNLVSGLGNIVFTGCVDYGAVFNATGVSFRLREDSISGTILYFANLDADVNGQFAFTRRYSPVSSGNKNFVLTATGTGGNQQVGCDNISFVGIYLKK